MLPVGERAAAWTERCGVKAVWTVPTTGRKTASDWNRHGQCHGRCSGTENLAKPSRMDGGTESKPYAGWCGTRELTTPGDPILSYLFYAAYGWIDLIDL
jgi:hypothetical protein